MTATLQDAIPRVFVSHSQEDSAFCHQLAQDLRHALGDDDAIWYEPDEEVAWSVVVRELTTRPIFVVILSPAAMTSPHIQYEIDLAWKQKNSPEGKEIIPVLYRPCAVRPDLGILHMVDLLPPRKYEVELVQLLKSIRDAGVMLGRQQSNAPAGAHEEPKLSGTQSGGQSEKETPAVKRSTHMIGRRQFITKAGLALGAAATLGIIVYSRIVGTSTSLTHASSKSVSRVHWHYETGGPITATPVIVDGTVYVTSQDGYLYSLDAGTGKLRWSYPPPHQILLPGAFSAPAVANGLVYAAWSSQHLYALDANNGRVRWHYVDPDLPLPNFSAPVVADRIVYTSSSDKYLIYAFDASQGSLLTRYSLPNTIGGMGTPPIISGEIIYLNVFDHVYALDTRNRELLWDAPTTDDTPTELVFSDGIVYFGSQDHLVYAIDAKTGIYRWQYITGDYIRSAPAVFNRILYVGSADQYMYALDASSGKLQWHYRAGAPIGSSPTQAVNRIYFTADDHTLYALDAHSGRFLWCYPVGNDVLTSPQIAEGIAYIGSSDHAVYALNIQE